MGCFLDEEGGDVGGWSWCCCCWNGGGDGGENGGGVGGGDGGGNEGWPANGGYGLVGCCRWLAVGEERREKMKEREGVGVFI